MSCSGILFNERARRSTATHARSRSGVEACGQRHVARQTFESRCSDYKPFRDVGGAYFDIIKLPSSRTLFVVADVSGKGMAAALLAANIQALVRSIANVVADHLAMARQINST